MVTNSCSLLGIANVFGLPCPMYRMKTELDYIQKGHTLFIFTQPLLLLVSIHSALYNSVSSVTPIVLCPKTVVKWLGRTKTRTLIH